MGDDARDPDGKQRYLFDYAPLPGHIRLPSEPEVIAPEFPVWTDNKARFIAAYLRYFVYITKHGTYIDGFAGPQEECETDSWARSSCWRANLAGCVNIDDMLAKSGISEKEATFCLLDQRTFECDWATVNKLARHKRSGHKIEIFYFLANGWLERALSGQKDMDKLARWWGRNDWTKLRTMSRDERRDAIVARMKRELGYKSAMPWPIFERQDGGKIMYYMIHATDHPEAPGQMSRAYRSIVRRSEPFEQSKFEFESESKGPPRNLPLPLTRSRALDERSSSITRPKLPVFLPHSYVSAKHFLHP